MSSTGHRTVCCAAGFALAALGACAGTRESAQTRRDDVGWLVVPASESSYYRFETSALAEHARNGALTPLAFAPAPPGTLLSSACDLRSATAAVAYGAALAVIDLAEGRVQWLPVGFRSPPHVLSVSGSLAATVAQADVSLWRVRDGQLLWSEDAGPWLKAHGLTQIDYALPLAPDEFLLIASKPVGFAAAAKLFAYRVSRAAGDWQSSTDHLIPEISNLHRCTSDGSDIYLAGVQEESRPGRGAGPELIQSLVVVRLSARDLSRVVLVREELHAVETEVVDLTAGPGWVGVVLRAGRTQENVLRIYRTSDEARGAQLAYNLSSPERLRATWVSERLAVVCDAQVARFVDVP